MLALWSAVGERYVKGALLKHRKQSKRMFVHCVDLILVIAVKLQV